MTCPVCKNPAQPVFRSKIGKEIYLCANKACRHFFTPVEREGQGVCRRDEESIEADLEQSSELFALRNETLLGLFEKLISTFRRPIVMIDYGAGAAHVSRTFKKLRGEALQIYCLEANPLCHPLYQKHSLLQIGSLSEIKEKADLIFMIEVIEHLPDPVGSLKEIWQVLNPGGVLFMSTPMGKRLEILTQAFARPSHLHFFTPTSLDLALTTAGFSPLENIHPEIMYPVPASLLPRTLTKIKAIIKNNFKFLKSHMVGYARPR